MRKKKANVVKLPHKLDVILRTCQASELSKKEMTRICGDDREQMIMKCLTSLVLAMNRSSFLMTLTVLDDHSTETFIEKLKILLDKCDHPTDLIHLEKTGPNHSAYEQFYRASQAEDLVYSVEDDYLHEPLAFNSMLNAYGYFSQTQNLPVMIFPFDCPLRYSPGKEAVTRLYHDGTRYWRNVTHTTNTFLTRGSTVKNNFEQFRRLAQEYPHVLEEDTINRLYYDEETKQGLIAVFNPIPSIAYHLSYTPHFSIRTSHASWEHVWDQTRKWDLIQGWFQYEDFYRGAIPSLHPRSRVVEVGAWLGKSTACLTTLCKQQGKEISVFAVDTWKGSDEEVHRTMIEALRKRGKTLRDAFEENMLLCDVGEADLIRIENTSIEASKLFENGSLDLVMLDASHEYADVRADILHWLPKIKPGGILAGDDFSDSWLGVKNAVNDFFLGRREAVQILGTTWFVRK